MKAGFRSNNIDPNARHCMACAAVGFMRTFGIDEPMGCYDDIEHADAFVLWGSNMAEMHPMLWQRVADRRLAHPHVQVAVLSTFEHRCYELADLPITFTPADRPRDPQLHRQLHHPEEGGQPGLRQQARRLQAGQRRHRLRPAPGARAAEGGEERRRPRRLEADRRSTSSRNSSRSTTSSTRRRSRACRADRLERLAQLYADPKVKVMSFWTMGFNQHTRGVWANHMVYNLHLLTGKIATPGQQPLLAHRPALGVRHGARGRRVLAPPARRHGGDEPEAPRDDRGDLEAARPARSRRSPASTRCCRAGC